MKYLDDKLQPEPYYADKFKYIGDINVEDGIIDITDPCYASDTWCARFGHKVKPGTYKCFIDVVNFPSKAICEESDHFLFATTKYKAGDLIETDDFRIMKLTIVHSDVEGKMLNKELMSSSAFKLIDSNIGVDAGLCGFYNHKPDFSDDEWDNFWQSLDRDRNYTCDCKHGNGVTVSSGFGDGCYSLLEAKNENGEVIALSLDFNYTDEFEE